MRLRITAVSDAGKIRGNNEDMVLVGGNIFRDSRLQGSIELDLHSSPYAVAISDGMGGANAGEVASQLVLEQLREGLAAIPENLNDEAFQDEIKALCLHIHRLVLSEGAANDAKRGMGATLVGLLHYQGRLFFVSAGDSRIYRFRDSTLMQVSRDHSLRELCATPDMPGNIILNSFGGGSSFFIDAGLAARKVLNEDVYLLCSDGVSDMLSDLEIEAILGADGREDALLAAAMNKGGQDNISYALVEVSGVNGVTPITGALHAE